MTTEEKEIVDQHGLHTVVLDDDDISLVLCGLTYIDTIEADELYERLREMVGRVREDD